MLQADTPVTGGTEEFLARTPVPSLVLAYAAMLPLAAGAVAASALPRRWADPLVRPAALWAGAVLCFLSGVKRGLSFRQPGGSTVSEIATMSWVFSLGAGGLLLPQRRASLLLLLAGYASVGVADTRAARAGEAPRYFARLRPVQMALPLVSLAILLARAGTGRTR